MSQLPENEKKIKARQAVLASLYCILSYLYQKIIIRKERREEED